MGLGLRVQGLWFRDIIITVELDLLQELFPGLAIEVGQDLRLFAAVERMWHIYDSQGQIVALAVSLQSLNGFQLFPLR